MEVQPFNCEITFPFQLDAKFKEYESSFSSPLGNVDFPAKALRTTIEVCGNGMYLISSLFWDSFVISS
jgi:hypothetical protein